MEGMGLEKGVKKAGTADVAHNDHILWFQTPVLKGLVKRVQAPVVRAAGAKNRGAIRVEKPRHSTPLPQSGRA
jgi:hypothetical protein